MTNIVKLPKQISDKIAAGEVVTGPVSVVKELTENSIDAGSDSVIVEIKEGGKSYIRVTDNGSGIAKGEVKIAFLPHATSKIKVEDDLDNINTLGFRGEALTSIATVSKLEMITKTASEKVGTSVYIEGGDTIEEKDIGTNTGTTIIVKDLYFNTPARLKFMKSDRAESAKIIDLISRLAIAYPKIKFRLINNGNILFSTNGKGDILTNIFQVYGTEASGSLLEITKEIDDYRIRAYISPSSQTKKTRKGQIYFVNGRVVSSSTIENAISKGYKEFLFEGRYPVAYLFLEINPLKLDVNVHPAKTEVRFNEQVALSEFISQAIYDRLQTKEAIPDIQVANHKKNHKQNPFKLNLGGTYGESSGVNSGVIKSERNKAEGNKSESGFNKADSNLSESKSQGRKSEPKSHGKLSQTERVNIKTLLSSLRDMDDESTKEIHKKDYTKPEEEKSGQITTRDANNKKHSVDDAYDVSKDNQIDVNGGVCTDIHIDENPVNADNLNLNADKVAETKSIEYDSKGPDIANLKVLGTVFATYILSADDDMFYIIDQHAAHERINYERFLRQFRSEDKLSQQILEAIVMNVSAGAMNHMDTWLGFLNHLGYETEIFGDKSIVIKAVPAFITYGEAREMLEDIVGSMDTGKAPENQKAIEKLIQRACKASVKANNLLKPAEIRALLEELSKCDNPFSCPHGRPVFVKLSKYDIEKLFRRV